MSGNPWIFIKILSRVKNQKFIVSMFNPKPEVEIFAFDAISLFYDFQSSKAH